MKIKYALASLLLAMALVTTSCKKAEETPTEPAKTAFDMAAAKTAVDAGYAEFNKAFNAKDAVALAACYSSDAKLMGPNDKAIEGRDNIQKMFSEWFKGETPQIKISAVEVWGNESLLVAESKYEMTMGGEVIDSGKAIEVHKMEDGKWKMLRDCYNSDMPMAPPPPPAK